MYVHGMRYLHHEVHELDGYNQEFWKTSGYSLKCVLELVALTSCSAQTHAKVPSNLSQTSSKAYIFSRLITANRIKPRSEIYQRYRHLNLPLDQKLHLLTQANHNFEINLMSFYFSTLIKLSIS